MDAPLRLAKPVNPQLPEGFVNNPINPTSEIQAKTESVATQALQHTQANPQSHSNPQLQTFAIENYRFGSVTHTMDKSAMSQEFLREMLRYFVSTRTDIAPPIATKRGDLVSLEFLFYQSLQKVNTTQAQVCEAVMRSHFPADPITRLCSAYLVCINEVQYDLAKTIIDAALGMKHCHLEALHLAAFLERRAGNYKQEIRYQFELFNSETRFKKFLNSISHRLEYVSALIEMFNEDLNNNLDRDQSSKLYIKEMEILRLFLENKYEECIEEADRLLKKHPKNSHVQETKLRALVANGKIDAARAFVSSKRLQLSANITYALIARDKQTAYQYYNKLLIEGQALDIPYWIILNFCDILEHVKIHPGDTGAAIQRLQSESRNRPNSVPVHRGLYILLIATAQDCRNQTPENLIAIRNLCVHLCMHDSERHHLYLLEQLKFLLRIGHGRSPEASEVARGLCNLAYAKDLGVEFVSEVVDLIEETTLGTNAALELSFNLYRQTQNVEYLYIHAKQLRALGRNKEANGLFDEYVSKNPTSLRAVLILLSFYVTDKEFRNAMLLCNCALDVFPNQVQLLSARGRLHFQFELFEDAIKDLSMVMNDPEAGLQDYVRRDLFHSYLRLGLHREAQAFLEKYGHQHIPKAFIEELRQQKARAKEEASQRKKETEPEPTPLSLIEPSSKTEVEIPAIAKDIDAPTLTPPAPAVPAAAAPEPVRNMEKKAPIHLQRLKHDITNLDPKIKFKGDLNSLPKTFAGACTIDEEIYGRQSAPTPVAVKKETVDIPRLTSEEFRRLERARLSIIAIGDLIKNDKVYCTANPTDPGNFLFPRNLAYQLLKFSDALVPTSLKQKDVRQVFKEVIQTHILSIDLIGKLRQAMRHEYQTVDMDRLKHFCSRLTAEKCTVQMNIEAFLQAIPKEKSDTAAVSFAPRTNLERKQTLKKDAPVDYLEEVKHELTCMARIADKFQLKQIDAENFYKDGLKMSICNIAECLRQLNVPEDKMLQQFFRFGNRIAHEVGEKPTWYVSEEMDIHQLGMILHKANVIKDRIINLVTHKEV